MQQADYDMQSGRLRWPWLPETSVVTLQGKTEVLVEEGMASVSYLLDESLMDFGTALEEHDFDRWEHLVCS